MNAKELAQRWKDDPRRAAAAYAWLSEPRSATSGAFESFGGRVDLRGLPTFPAGSLRTITGTEWEGIDLSYADLSGLRLRDVRLSDCRLEGANLKRAVLAHVVCERVDLVSADFERASLGGLFPRTASVWSSVDFSMATLNRSAWVGATLTGCTFTNTKLKGAEFLRCLITDSSFASDLTEVVFDGVRMAVAQERPFPHLERVPLRDVDFSGSEFFFTEFRHCAVEARWPDAPEVRVISDPAAVVERAIEWLVADGGRNNVAAAKGLQRLLDEVNIELPGGTPFIVVNLAEWETPPFAADVEEALFGAGQQR